MDDRVSYAPKMLPFVLSGLADDTTAVQVLLVLLPLLVSLLSQAHLLGGGGKDWGPHAWFSS